MASPSSRLTALESGKVGLVCLGTPDDVGRLILHARELGQETAAVLTPAGIFFVATWPQWTLREVERG